MRLSAGESLPGSLTQSLAPSPAGRGGDCRSGSALMLPRSLMGRMVSAMSWGSFSSRRDILPLTIIGALSLIKPPPESSVRWNAMSSIAPLSSSRLI